MNNMDQEPEEPREPEIASWSVDITMRGSGQPPSNGELEAAVTAALVSDPTVDTRSRIVTVRARRTDR